MLKINCSINFNAIILCYKNYPLIVTMWLNGTD